MSWKNPVVNIAGPPASGKSALAFALAREFTGTVVNADSMQVYRELRVLTARPGAEKEARAPHRLFGVLPASEVCSAGRWLKMAVVEIEKAHATTRLPIVVGGTGLYLKVLTEGLAAIPDIPDSVNEEVRDLYDRLGGEAFRDELAKRDAEAAERLSAGDGQRLTRAMAVVRATGRTLSDWRRDQGPGPALDILLTGRRFGAAEAYELGLVNRVVPRERLQDEAEALMGRILEQDTLAVRYAKRAVVKGMEMPLGRALELETRLAAPRLGRGVRRFGGL